MTKLTEGMVIGRTRAADLASVRRLNCWGSELSDVSLVRSMKFVEVLSLSVNKITTLADFAHCPNLQELFVRKNQISDLSEILYLKDLPKLHSFWLEDNPCAVGDRYRLTVLKYLPQLKKLDNIAVQPEELRDAIKYGIVLEQPGDKDSTCAVQSPTSESNSSPSAQNSTPSPSHSGGHHIPQPPERDNDFDVEGNVFPTYAVGSPDSQQADKIPYVTSTYVNSGDKVPAPREVSHPSDHLTPDDSSLGKINRRSRQETFVHGSSFEKEIMSPPTDQQSPIMTHDHRPHQQSLPPISNMVPPPPLSRDQREFHELHHSHSISTHSHPNVHMVHSDVYAELAPEDHEPRFREEVYRYSVPPQPPPPLVMQHPAHQSLLKHHPHGQLYEKIMDSPNKPYPTRPKNRNSNILSAVLCLIKELDCASLEVVEMAARCRMDELDD